MVQFVDKFYCVILVFIFLSSFLVKQRNAETEKEENLPKDIAERMTRLEIELKTQKEETENLKTTIMFQKQSFETHIERLDQKIELLTQFSEEQMVTIERLENELELMRVRQGHEKNSQTANATLGLSETSVVVNGSERKFPHQRYLLGDMADSLVGFTAYLDHDTPNLGINQIIVFNKVLFNEGSGYNNSSGIFVCPVDGVYMFYFSVSNRAGHQIVAKLVVNGINYVDAIADSDGGNAHTEAQGSNMAILSLSKGSHVCVENYRWGQQQADGAPSNRFTSFSGIRLY